MTILTLLTYGGSERKTWSNIETTGCGFLHIGKTAGFLGKDRSKKRVRT